MNYPNTQLFIDGKWQDAVDGRTLAVLNPATGQEIGRVARAGKAELENSVEAAEKGFQLWRNSTVAERSRVMRRAATLLRERAEAIATILTTEQGKPFAEARIEVLAAADIIEWFAEEGFRVYGRLVPSRKDPAIRQMVVKDPVGPVAAFTPWNFPINQMILKVSAALAAGCSVVAKASEETPAAPAALVKVFADAGIPAGVLGLVYGDPAEISTYLITHPVIRKVTFTGSTPVGKQLAALASAHMKRATMELGGHAPVIVCEDADIDAAVKAAGFAKFRNAGQVCISPTRFLVHKSIAREFGNALGEHAAGLQVGDGLKEGTQMGPLANSRRLDAMAEFMRDAREKGANVLTGGTRIGEVGNFWAPTVLTNVPLDSKVFNEEPFGPIAAIRSFSDMEEAISEANRLSFGLAGYGFTRSLKNADLLARKVEVGMMWINMPASTSPELPFGGIKDSGYGSEGGPEALEAYLNVRSVVVLNA
ncbi:NAD-dependent succinate-semialdehyde dehydrogenase [Cupriavidus consociatus]|uniref:NAD-dependent succinate-semialdehyde dehydrogenase n=1 Tax=Cupriavidus consociatus TaxID=2821357 RepID=UPI001AE1817A|nr:MULTISPECIES: NAD-dependent succinate-semialdehyde dehydrogenase [unclassified Cupriavidus]MBP0625399.1 NAD-dependent succinate-semialdehyde dehydrogenase [Cupriavidus sp. LEh25]MDK2662141.1 NAD-dependent succinate-semialdehyde dehydrogenase [Cupriavidus sp. LEh21]